MQITPLPEPEKTGYLTGLIEDAVAKGAQVIISGGQVIGGLMRPAVLYPVGPVVPVASFRDVEEPLDYVINSDYGQQVSVFGSDPDVIASLIDPLVNQVCRVNINSQCQRGPDVFPFTGRKNSAEGTLSVSDALRVFSIRTLVAAKDTEENRQLIRTIVNERKSRFLSTDFIL